MKAQGTVSGRIAVSQRKWTWGLPIHLTLNCSGKTARHEGLPARLATMRDQGAERITGSVCIPSRRDISRTERGDPLQYGCNPVAEGRGRAVSAGALHAKTAVARSNRQDARRRVTLDTKACALPEQLAIVLYQ